MKIKLLWGLAMTTLLFAACDAGNTSEATTEQAETTDTNTVETPKPMTETDKITQINASVQKIDDNTTYRIEKKRYINHAKDMAHDQSLYTISYDADAIAKLMIESGEGGYYGQSIHYYRDGKLQMIHNKGVFMDSPFSDYHVYIEDNEPFAAIGKEKEAEDESTDLATIEAKNVDLNKAIPNMEDFKEMLKKLPARLAAAKKE